MGFRLNVLHGWVDFKDDTPVNVGMVTITRNGTAHSISSTGTIAALGITVTFSGNSAGFGGGAMASAMGGPAPTTSAPAAGPRSG